MKGRQSRTVWELGAVTLAAVAAILSCISPATAVFAGDAGLADSSAFDQWRPYLLLIAFALLALGFYST